ncbi:hypothetical protein [Streptomyces sp. NPDC058701]|uniref:hypothetical protein n=1 Tax=Streptomyces sp. NPDC058701 TaxID=3346608 RepID=UPI00365D3137
MTSPAQVGPALAAETRWDEVAPVVALVQGLEPGLREAVIRDLLKNFCVSRVKRRRLVRALYENPELLTCGEPRGPIAVDDFIHRLVAAGAKRVVVPLCPLCRSDCTLDSTLNGQRVCLPCKTKFRANTRPCTSCGSTLNVNCRDRQGRPVCLPCRPGHGEDPVARLVGQISPLTPGVAVDRLQEAIRASNKQPYALLKVSWEIEDRPGLLTGEGAEGSPHLIRLLERVTALGASRVVLPPCPQCSEEHPLHFKSGSQRVCRRCYDRLERTEQCSGCGEDRVVVGRTEAGAALCGTCNSKNPANFEKCIRCDRTAPVGRRTPEGVHCRACYRLPVDLCSVCCRRRPCIGASTSSPICDSCSQVRRLCHRCGRIQKARARVPEGHLCQSCFAKDPVAFRTCADCGEVAVLWGHGLCPPCACRNRVRELLVGPDEAIRPGMDPVFTALTGTENARTVLRWLEPGRKAAEVLALLGTDDAPISHETLDRHTPNKSVQHIREVLVTARVLPARDEHMIALLASVEASLESIADPEDRKLITAFARWDRIGRLRHRLSGRHATYHQIRSVRCEVKAAIRLAAWLRQQGTELGECHQGHIDRWLVAGTSVCLHARPFVRWAVANHHAKGLEIPPPERIHPTEPLDTERRIALAEKLLTDSSIRLDDRVAGLLVLLFAQSLATVAALRTDQVIRDDRGVHLRLGDEPLHLPGPLGVLVDELVAARRSRAIIGRKAPNPWLFPGNHPTRNLTPATLMTRLKRLGVRARATQHAALRDLGAELPATVINRLLGISIISVDRWRDGGEYGAYAAEIARR